MPLPLILGAAIRGLGPGLLRGLAGDGRGGLLGAIAGGPSRRRRHRRAKLSARDMQELIFIRNTLGKTAAAQALPFFLRRG